MTKKIIAQMLAYFAEDKKKHHFIYMAPERNERLTEDENVENAIVFAANVAGTKIVKGKVEWGNQYLVTRGEALDSFGLEADVTLEVSNHWPWAFCYMYKL